MIRFAGYPGKYVFHCHNLEHEGHGHDGQLHDDSVTAGPHRWPDVIRRDDGGTGASVPRCPERGEPNDDRTVPRMTWWTSR
ncbi:MAG TPA: multicopper oxidase domain-containing protein [Mycobacteriales bacterium]|jgi:hypothetical protein|nr:multicopper oxidase domain-containing protein [Mycobacteriales bacterium]